MKLLTRSRSRSLVTSAKWLTLAAALALTFLWLVSTRYHFGLTGKPFNHAYSISGGEACVEWYSREPDGSLSGFGNPGWKLRPRKEHWIRWRPHISTSASGTLHHVVIPLWPLPLIFAAASWRFARAARRLRDPAFCSSCGYPRRGLPTGAPCPECGTLTRLFRTVAQRLSAVAAPRVRSHPQPAR